MINNQRFLNGIQLVLDLLCVKLVCDCTIQARIALNPLLNAQVTADQARFWVPNIGLVVPLWLLASYRFRLYRSEQKGGSLSVLASASESALVLTMITAVVAFFSRELGGSVSRLFVPVMLPVSFIILLLARCLTRVGWSLTGHTFERRPLRVALVGAWDMGSTFLRNLQITQTQVFRGLIVPECDFAAAQGCAVPILGTTRQIAELVNRERIDRVVMLDSSLPATDLEHCSQVLKRMGVPMSCALQYPYAQVSLDLTTDYGVPSLELVPIKFTHRQAIIKRTFDIAISAISLLLFAPILITIALLIRLSSQGPVLYKASRIGKGGRYFTFLKFRSMYVNADRRQVAMGNEKGGHIFKMRNDPRVTPIGRFLRRYSLDELPQLINILLGDMSFVGPRPLPACDLGLDGMSKEFSAWSEGRAQVPPGLTGLWQISGRSDLPFEDMVRLDLSYIQNWSLALDLRIVFKTPMLVLRGSGAY